MTPEDYGYALFSLCALWLAAVVFTGLRWFETKKRPGYYWIAALWVWLVGIAIMRSRI